jgi:hypothetical protein
MKAIGSDLNLTERPAGCVREIRDEIRYCHQPGYVRFYKPFNY